MDVTNVSFAPSDAFIARVSSAFIKKKKVVFLFGSGLTLPVNYGPGVLGVSAIIDLINERLKVVSDVHIEVNSERIGEAYQKAMQTLLEYAGQDELNEVIVEAVLNSNTRKAEKIDNALLEKDLDSWCLNNGVSEFSKLIANNPESNITILTTNFDPLVEVGMKRLGVNVLRITLPHDGKFYNSHSSGSTRIVHLHGFWYGTDTLHTTNQITKSRPQLKGDLRDLLNDSLLVVMGYGGWNDSFTKVLVELIQEKSDKIDVLWGFYDSNSEDIYMKNHDLLENLLPASDSRVIFYKDIDTNVVFERINDRIGRKDIVSHQFEPTQSLQVNINDPKDVRELGNSYDKCDMPPDVSHLVGRDKELEILDSEFKAFMLTGIGGQGKSALASYFVKSINYTSSDWEFYDWRDCKEEENRLYSKIISIIERLTAGEIGAKNFSDAPIDDLIESFFNILGNRKIIFVFDNIDRYIDYDKFYPIQGMKILFNYVLNAGHKSKFIFTCRPKLKLTSPEHLNIPLAGLSIDNTQALFDSYKPSIKQEELQILVRRAHDLTNGHPLWLKLIAGQSKRGKQYVSNFIEDIDFTTSSFTEEDFSAVLAENTLNVIWASLNQKQQTLLRALAETVKSEPLGHLEAILTGEMNFNSLTKSLRTLIDLNLVEVKQRTIVDREYDLHPLVKEYIRNKFSKLERSKYLTLLVNYYDKVVCVLKEKLNFNSTLLDFENYTSKIELEINSGELKKALVSLHEIAESIIPAGHNEEFLRLSFKLYFQLDWDKAINEEYTYFHDQFKLFMKFSTEFSRNDYVENFLEKYERSIPANSILYVHLCELKCYYYWFNTLFDEAIKWGEKGIQLIEKNNIDSSHSSVKHDLALAYRDTKNPENVKKALKHFLYGEDINKLLSDDLNNNNFDGTFFGNLGRCMWFLGDHDSAKLLYAKSFEVLKNGEPSISLSINQGYAGFWLGELFFSQSSYNNAALLFEFAIRKWKVSAPAKVLQIEGNMKKITNGLADDISLMDDWELDSAIVKILNIK